MTGAAHLGAQEQTSTEQMLSSLQRQVGAQASSMEALQASIETIATSQKQLVSDLAAHIESTRQMAAKQHQVQAGLKR